MNDKSILIIPTPRDCEHCDLPFTIDEILGRVVCWEDEYGKHCPLEPREQYVRMSIVEDVIYFECEEWRGLAKTIINEIKERMKMLGETE